MTKTEAGNLLNHSGWFQSAEMRERWPLSLEDAAFLLSEGGQYDIDPTRLSDLVERGLIHCEMKAGCSQWTATDIIAAADMLGFRRQWQPTPSGHDDRKHRAQLIIEKARDKDVLAEKLSDSTRRCDARHLIAALMDCDDRDHRENLAWMLIGVLEVDHEIRI